MHCFAHKDWKEVEKRQNKMGIQVFLARRGIGYNKPVAVVRPMPRNPKFVVYY